jgi:hypothetical protein
VHDRHEIYQELLSSLTSGLVKLLDNKRLISQLGALERRIFPSGNERIDHPVGSHDDVANACAGALVLAASKKGPLKISAEVLRRAGQRDLGRPNFIRFGVGGSRW